MMNLTKYKKMKKIAMKSPKKSSSKKSSSKKRKVIRKRTRRGGSLLDYFYKYLSLNRHWHKFPF